MSCNWLLKCNIISDTTSGFSSAAFLEPSRSRAQAQADGFGDSWPSSSNGSLISRGSLILAGKMHPPPSAYSYCFVLPAFD
ncbi:Peptidase family M50 [Musa troglodytarum]|uniref:Peptidase family M50 n=1 Tax=Musa troglodytarum TaxID=320322 RepID=A0A9E7G4L8_9LILI|nr:Peptidase family M50 [Musa troglodytarum]URE05817.1 Peptidase family M50 [Musa troglodytarum]